MQDVSSDSHLVLTVLPFGKNVVLEESSDLNLTCKVKSSGHPNERFDLSWKLPTRANEDGDRISVYETDDQLTVTIHNLQDDDSGTYICELQNKGIRRTKKIAVFVRSKKCARKFFDCGSGVCVPKHYVCDGYVDCPSGYDESFKHCGPDACHGKILCDGRCIPKEFCCDPEVDVNCSVNYIMPCCQGILHPELNSVPCSATVDCHYGRFVGFGNSIVYIVASCAVVVIVVSTVVMFLACRICSQRSDELRLSRLPEGCEFQRNFLSAAMHQRDMESLENLDILFDDMNINSDHYRGNDRSENYLLMNYEDGILVGFGDCGPKPPPYTENSIGIPPPPYESMTDIPSAVKDVPEQEENASNHETSEE